MASLPVTIQSNDSKEACSCEVSGSLLTEIVSLYINAVPPPLSTRGLCLMVYPLGSISFIVTLSSSVPVNQVSVMASMSRVLSMINSFMMVVLLQTDQGFRVQIFRCSVGGGFGKIILSLVCVVSALSLSLLFLLFFSILLQMFGLALDVAVAAGLGQVGGCWAAL